MKALLSVVLDLFCTGQLKDSPKGAMAMSCNVTHDHDPKLTFLNDYLIYVYTAAASEQTNRIG